MRGNKRTEDREKETKGERQKGGWLWKLWLLLGMLCLAYFIPLICYTGFTNIFYFFWFFCGIFFFICSWMAKTHFVKKYIPRWLKWILGILLGMGIGFFLMIEIFIFTGFYKTPSEEVDYVIVLGAHVRNGVPSRVLAQRLDAAFAYAMEHERVIVIVSGGQGSNESTTEAFAMANYLEAKGLDRARILLEENATNTNENLDFSKELMAEGATAAVVSNDFHIFRAVHLARNKGIPNAQGLAARDDIRTLPANLAREFFGVVKDWVMGNMELFPLW